MTVQWRCNEITLHYWIYTKWMRRRWIYSECAIKSFIIILGTPNETMYHSRHTKWMCGRWIYRECAVKSLIIILGTPHETIYHSRHTKWMCGRWIYSECAVKSFIIILGTPNETIDHSMHTKWICVRWIYSECALKLSMGWQRSVCSLLNCQVSFEKEPYFCKSLLQKRHGNTWSLHFGFIPYHYLRHDKRMHNHFSILNICEYFEYLIGYQGRK